MMVFETVDGERAVWVCDECVFLRTEAGVW